MDFNDITLSEDTPRIDESVNIIVKSMKTQLFNICSQTVEYMKTNEELVKDESNADIVQKIMGAPAPKKGCKSSDFVLVDGIKIPLNTKVKITKQKKTQAEYDACSDKRKINLCNNIFTSGTSTGNLCLGHPTTNNKCNSCLSKKNKEDPHMDLKEDASKLSGRHGINSYVENTPKCNYIKVLDNDEVLCVVEPVEGLLTIWNNDFKKNECVGYVENIIKSNGKLDLYKCDIIEPPLDLVDKFESFGMFKGTTMDNMMKEKTKDTSNIKASFEDTFDINIDGVNTKYEDSESEENVPDKEDEKEIDYDSDDFGGL